MNTFTRIFCLVLVAAALILVAFGVEAHPQVNRIKSRALSTAERVSGDHFDFETETPEGARIFAVKEPSREMLEAIDSGLDDLFAVARKNGYRKELRHRDYTIFIGSADRTKDAKGNYSPDIAVGAAQYAGTKYDKGGYIYAAGMVISPSERAFLIASHKKDFERASRIVRYEGEHIVLYFNDQARYEKTKDHSRSGGHPILN